MKNKTFNNIINLLNSFWNESGCTILQPIDKIVGAATFHPATFINAINSKQYKASYTQTSRRPFDIRYSNYSNRLPLFHQYQVILKPSPSDIQELYLNSLKYIGIDLIKNDIRFVEDNWESPTLGAYGIGWEVWLNGMEITQFTYFQQMGGLNCYPIMIEIAYGLERICMYIQDTININELIFDINKSGTIKYKDLFLAYEKELSIYLSTEINTKKLFERFEYLEKECENILDKNLPLIAYDFMLDLSNIFNTLDARSCFALTERQIYILKIRSLSNKIAKKIKYGK